MSGNVAGENVVYLLDVYVDVYCSKSMLSHNSCIIISMAYSTTINIDYVY